MTDPRPDTAAFRAARDLLLATREDYEAAKSQFRWPELTEFNFALDWFDVLAAEQPETTALRVLTERSDERLSYAELAARSDQVASWLRGHGVRRGDRLLIMLPNVVPLWEVTLAAMKLGAVISPASTLLTPADLQRPHRARRHAPRGHRRRPWPASSMASPGPYTAHRGGRAGREAPGWPRYDDAYRRQRVQARGRDPGERPVAALLHLRHHRQAQARAPQPPELPGRHLSTMYWIGLRPGDVHQNVCSPGWAKHAWSSFFAPWNAGATVFVHNYARFGAAALSTPWCATG